MFLLSKSYEILYRSKLNDSKYIFLTPGLTSCNVFEIGSDLPRIAARFPNQDQHKVLEGTRGACPSKHLPTAPSEISMHLATIDVFLVRRLRKHACLVVVRRDTNIALMLHTFKDLQRPDVFRVVFKSYKVMKNQFRKVANFELRLRASFMGNQPFRLQIRNLQSRKYIDSMLGVTITVQHWERPRFFLKEACIKPFKDKLNEYKKNFSFRI
ncbi:hypothetical protein BpHYR1_019855 [Brachionus plicatilis]|uniref:Uncharacterized protein n=1 Tax=Brachionus plicatilis TaxID=10195 RepID=A0A3M7R2X1_BRAPC|nr:hypothetical protein BpHYR1_019855 [Brachionus plicatilis]